ncbi:MAG TPA: TPM domain-containing protein [Candidatus Binatia bacterium]|nr:TPM domain-containing protein [Candidatus Binatia bacterium]
MIQSGTRHRRPATGRRPALCGLVFLAALVPAWARFPLPPHGDRSVHDLAGVLDPATETTMERRHTELFQKTRVAIVVVTVPRLENETLSDFAVRVGSEWGAGKKGEDRGIVVAVTTEEPHIFVATGYGVEGFLPDGRVGSILDRDAVAPLRARNFDAALNATSAALVAACAAEYGVTIEGIQPSRRPDRPSRIPWPVLLFLLFLAFMFFTRLRMGIPLGVGRRSRRGIWYGGGFGGGGFGGGFGGGGGGGFGGFGGGGFGGGGAGR